MINRIGAFVNSGLCVTSPPTVPKPRKEGYDYPDREKIHGDAEQDIEPEFVGDPRPADEAAVLAPRGGSPS